MILWLAIIVSIYWKINSLKSELIRFEIYEITIDTIYDEAVHEPVLDYIKTGNIENLKAKIEKQLKR